MISISSVLQKYPDFIAPEVKDRFFKHQDLLLFLTDLKTDSRFNITRAGESAEGRSIQLISYGEGPVKIFLWSQMHGNEATATMALLDLFNAFRREFFKELAETISSNCTLYILPIVNPDGTEVFSRRNAMQIDINRDFHHQQTPEGKLLRAIRDEINPEYGFNLHDQSTMWSAGNTGNPASISLLAPAFDESLNVNQVRHKAMQVIVEMNETLQQIIPDHVGRFNDEYEPRAFGDNFQAAGTSTILIEAGGYADDPEKQQIRKYFFAAVLKGLLSIASKSYSKRSPEQYFNIPENKLFHFQIMLRNVQQRFNDKPYSCDLGLIIKETINEDLRSVTKTYFFGDIGDLTNRYGYRDVDCSSYTCIQTSPAFVDEPVHLILMNGLELILEIENGLVTTDNI